MTTDTKPKRTLVGIELIRLLTAEGDRIFTIERARELAPRVGLRDAYLREALYHLRQNGWIVSLRRGLYALCPTVPGVPAAHEYEIAMFLVSPATISHWSALSHHGLTEQPPLTVFVSTTTQASIPRARREETVGTDQGYQALGTSYRFIQFKPERYFGVGREWINDAPVWITDLERTLLDALAMPQYCGGFAEALHAFQLGLVNLDIDRIVDYALRLDGATAKRLGWVLERNGVDSPHLDALAAVPVKGYTRLDVTGPRKGRCNGYWKIQENLPGMLAW